MFLKNEVNFRKHSVMFIENLSAMDANACGDTDTTIIFFLSSIDSSFSVSTLI